MSLTDAPIKCSTFFTVKKCSHFNISIYKMGTSLFSSDLSLGRRPMSKSDEKREVPILFIEIWPTVLLTFSDRCLS